MKYLNKIIEYGLYLLVFLLPIQARWIIKAGKLNSGYWEYGSISLYGTDILLFVLIALFGVWYIKRQGIRNPSKMAGRQESGIKGLWWIIAGLELFIFISIFVVSEKLVAVQGYIRFLLGIGLFWLIISANYNKIKLLFSFLAGVFLQACLGIWQFLTQSSFSNKWLGAAKHNPEDLGASVVETLSGERWLRAYGSLDHPNILGGLLAIGLLLTIYFLLIYFNRNNNELHFKKLCFYVCNFLFIPIFLISLVFTFSRGAWAGLIVGILIFLFIAVARRDLFSQRKLLRIIMVSGIIVFIFFNLYEDLFLTRLSNDTRLEIKSNMERVESYNTAKNVIYENWLLGVGIGDYTKYIYKNINSNLESWNYQPVHNIYLLVIAEIGIIGFLFFIGLFIYLVYLIDKNNTKFNIYNLSILFAILAMFAIDHWWWSLHFGIVFFWLILGIITGDIKENKNKIIFDNS